MELGSQSSYQLGNNLLNKKLMAKFSAQTQLSTKTQCMASVRVATVSIKILLS
jgi:hypothetical protein